MKIKTLILLLSPILTCAAVADTLKLAADGKALCQIVISDSPSAVERTAAKELKEHLDIMARADFPILPYSKAENGKASIYVGDSPGSKKILGELDMSSLPADTVILKSSGNSLALAGHPKRGSLYAVYTLLEDELGVRWWTASERFIPDNPSPEVRGLNMRYSPPLKTREALYKLAFDPVFATRMKQNGSTLTRMNFDRPTIPPEYGGCERLVLFKGRGSSFHSHYEILPPDKYFAKHPEWYGEKDGKRTHNHGQLCLTNPEMAAEYLKEIKKLLAENPDATAIQVSQNDWRNPCECKKCKSFEAAHGRVHSATNIYFANLMGEGIEKEFPNVFIDTFAYQYTRKAPSGIAPRKNVLVRLCSIECNFLRPMTDISNKAFADDMRDWGKLTHNLFIWDYVTDFTSYMLPFPNMRVLSPNIKFFTDNGAAGIFEQGDAFCEAGDFVRLRNWVISHLMWNPHADAEKLFDEFLFGYYGKEIGAIFKEYLKVLHDSAEKSGVRLTCYSYCVPAWLDSESFTRARALMERALETAKKLEAENPEKYCGLTGKVAREKIPIDYAAVVFYVDFHTRAARAGKDSGLPEDPLETARSICKLWDSMKVSTWREFTTPEDFKNYKKSFLKDAAIQKNLVDISGIVPKKDADVGDRTLSDMQEPRFCTQDKTNTRFFLEPHADPAASNGYYAELTDSSGSINVYADEIECAGIIGKGEKRKVSLYASLKIDETAPKGALCWVKVVKNSYSQVFRRKIDASETEAGAFKTIHLCDFEMQKGASYRFALISLGDGKNSRTIHLDRIMLADPKAANLKR